MAIAPTNKTSGSAGSAGTSSNTASHTPTANTLQLLHVQAWDAAVSAVPAFTITGNGLTWVQIQTITSGGVLRQSVYRALGASPSAGVTQIQRNISSWCSWGLIQVAGIDTSGTNGSGAVVQNATNQSASATTLTATLAAFANAANRPFLFGEGEDPNTSIGASDFTGLNAVNNYATGGYIININTAWKDAVDLTAVVTQASASFLQLIALEIAAAPVTGQGPLLGGSRNRIVVP